MSRFERVALRVLFEGLRAMLCIEWNDVVSIGGTLRASPCHIKLKWE